MHLTPRPLGARLLVALALLAAIFGGLVLALTALGFGHADVRGLRLTGGWRLAFLAGLGLAVAGCVAGAVGLRRARPWGVGVLAAVGPVVGLVCLALDRLVPAPGVGRPLGFYLLGVGLLPATLTLLLARVGRRTNARGAVQHGVAGDAVRRGGVTHPRGAPRAGRGAPHRPRA